MNSRVKACTRCRQHKLRCDAYNDRSRPCSTCAKQQVECVVNPAFQPRRSKTKVQMQAELDKLKQSLQGQSSKTPTTSPRQCAPMLPADQEPPDQTDMWHFSPLGLVQPLDLETMDNFLANTVTEEPGALLRVSTLSTDSIYGDYDPTTPRTLYEQEFDTVQIDECFKLFFKCYVPKVPIFDSTVTPNAYHAQSPLLFWTMIAIGCRKYLGDPTMLSLLAPRVMELAKSAVFSCGPAVPTIQAFILLCLWPMPAESLDGEFTSTIAGTALYLGMTAGLHVDGTVEDFPNAKIRPDFDEKEFRARVWSACLTICQNVTWSYGYPPPTFLNILASPHRSEGYLDNVPSYFRFQRKLNELAVLSTTQIGRMTSLRPDRRRSIMYPMINHLSMQAAELESECPDQLSYLSLLSVRLHIQCFQFFVPQEDLNISALAEAHTSACELVEKTMDLDRDEDYSGSATAYISRLLHLAACTILRIQRSQFSQSADSQRGQKAYFSAIVFLKKMSIQNDDTYARASIILTQLWGSKNIFKKPDGTIDSLSLRFQNRLSMSVVYDCFWWWRQEQLGSNDERGITMNFSLQNLNNWINSHNHSTAKSQIAAHPLSLTPKSQIFPTQSPPTTASGDFDPAVALGFTPAMWTDFGANDDFEGINIHASDLP